MTIRIRRVYDPETADDGCRVLVDRLWPRGVSKERAHLEVWLKDVAPSTELRTWWNHDPEKRGEFEVRYLAELDGNTDTVRAVEELRALASRNAVTTLLYGARDPKMNHARILADYLEQNPGGA